LIEIGVAVEPQNKKKLSDELRKRLLKLEQLKAKRGEKKKLKEEKKKTKSKEKDKKDPPEVSG
jgi:DNA repair ATPase RecN